jgi:guanosine-3',5'-bis(diphosphate) 3'-pyrophosphohydrolase
MAKLLQKAIDLAVKAHRDAEDPPGEPYVVHVMRVMLAVSQPEDAHQDERLRCVAMLHDTLERGGISAKDLRAAGLPSGVVRAVKLLTHDKGTSYAEYVVKLAKDPLAKAVKIADLMDNADLRRVTFRPGKSKKDIPRLVRYAASYKFLTGQMDEKAYRKIMRRGES